MTPSKACIPVVTAGLLLLAGLASAQGADAGTGGKLSDAEIVTIVKAANDVDIQAGKLAQKKRSHPDVFEFGRQMDLDHTAVNQQADALLKKLKLKPKESAVSKSLREEGKKTAARLEKLKGEEFSRAYLENEVAFHQKVIDAADSTLVPSAKSEEVRGFLTKVRPALVQHLEHAQMELQRLAKGASAGSVFVGTDGGAAGGGESASDAGQDGGTR